MKNSIFIIALVLYPFISVASHPLADSAATMQPGTWKELPVSGFTSTLDVIDCHGGSGSTKAMDWSENLCYSPIHEEVFYNGAGHLRKHTFMRFNLADNTWRRHCAGMPECMLMDGYEGCFTHGYDLQTIDPATGIFYYDAGGKFWAFNPSTEIWTGHSIVGSLPGGGFGYATEYFPPANKMVRIRDGSIGIGNMDGSDCRIIQTGLAGMGPYHHLMAYSSKQRRLYLGGGNGSPALWIMDSTLAVRRIADAPGQIHVSYSTLTTDPVTGDLLFLSDDDSLYAYDIYSDAWSNLVESRPPFNSHALATPIDNYGVTLFAIRSPYSIYLYKHAGSNDTLSVDRVEGIPASATIEQYLSLQLSAKVTYSNGEFDTTFRAGFVSLNPFVATINSAGLLTAHNEGTAMIRIQKKDKYDTVEVTVVSSTAILDSIRIIPDTMKILAGDSFQLTTYGYYHKNEQTFVRGIDTVAEWNSSSSAVASVVNGFIRGISSGESIISATIGGVSKSCAFTIWPRPAFVRRINFTTDTIPHAYGWKADNGRVYSALRQFGWASIVSTSRGDRGGSNILLKGFVAPSVRTNFRMDAPDGEYIIKAGVGDNQYGGLSMIEHAGDTLVNHSAVSNAVIVDTIIVSGGNGIVLGVYGKICYVVAISRNDIDINLVADDGGLKVTAPGTGIESGLKLAITNEIKAIPNPFNPTVKLIFGFVAENQQSSELVIYNTMGKIVHRATITNLSGGYTWNAKDQPTGYYLVRLINGERKIGKRLLLTR